MDDQDSYYLLRWSDHISNYAEMFLTLREQEEFVDCSIACEDGVVGAHRLVLAGCSPYLRDLLKRPNNPHPIIFLLNVSRSTVLLLMEFIYRGQAHIPHSRLHQLVTLGKNMQIKGLSQIRLPERFSPVPPTVPRLHGCPDPNRELRDETIVERINASGANIDVDMSDVEPGSLGKHSPRTSNAVPSSPRESFAIPDSPRESFAGSDVQNNNVSNGDKTKDKKSPPKKNDGHENDSMSQDEDENDSMSQDEEEFASSNDDGKHESSFKANTKQQPQGSSSVSSVTVQKSSTPSKSPSSSSVTVKNSSTPSKSPSSSSVTLEESSTLSNSPSVHKAKYKKSTELEQLTKSAKEIRMQEIRIKQIKKSKEGTTKVKKPAIKVKDSGKKSKFSGYKTKRGPDFKKVVAAPKTQLYNGILAKLELGAYALTYGVESSQRYALAKYGVKIRAKSIENMMKMNATRVKEQTKEASPGEHKSGRPKMIFTPPDWEQFDISQDISTLGSEEIRKSPRKSEPEDSESTPKKSVSHGTEDFYWNPRKSLSLNVSGIFGKARRSGDFERSSKRSLSTVE